MKLELYTRPMWLDCKAAKEFLSQKRISFNEINVSANPEKEAELKKLTGSRIVPGFIFTLKKWGLMKKTVVFTGFEVNQRAIEELIYKKK